MKINKLIRSVAVTGALLSTSIQPTFGAGFGAIITICDNLNPSVANFTGDEIVTPGFNPSTFQPPQPLQVWDLEGVFLNNSVLSLIGGYDFVNGQSAINEIFGSGDIFLDVTGDAIWGAQPPAPFDFNPLESLNTYGYDYVVHFHRNADGTLVLQNCANGSGTVPYDVYRIDTNSLVARVTSFSFPFLLAGPWLYDAASPGPLLVSGSAIYQPCLSDAQTGFLVDTDGGMPGHPVILPWNSMRGPF
jgi:hypothetical protein